MTEPGIRRLHDGSRSEVVHCYVPNDGSAMSAAVGRHVEKLVGAWLPRISGYVGRGPAGPIEVYLKPGYTVSRTRGNRILLPYDPGAPTPAEALARANAGLSHELVHAVVGRLADEVMNEGLAVHVDASLCLGGPAWPFGEVSPHRWVTSFVDDGCFIPLADLLAGRGISAGNRSPANLMFEWARYYLEAGSLVGFIVSELGMARFLSECGSGVPFEALGGAEGLEGRWLATLGGALTTEDQARMHRSVTAWADRNGDVDRSARSVREGR